VNDLKWTWNGDLIIDQYGDLADTADNSLRSFIQEIRTRVRSDLGDWRMQPHVGASLSELIGEPNSEETAEAGKVRIISALTKDNFIAATAIRIRYTPVDQNAILYNIQIRLPDLTNDEVVNLTLVLDIDEYEVTFLE